MNAPVTPDLAGFAPRPPSRDAIVSVLPSCSPTAVTPVYSYHHLHGDRTNTFLFRVRRPGDAGALLDHRRQRRGRAVPGPGPGHLVEAASSPTCPGTVAPLAVLAETLERLHTLPRRALPR